MKKIFISYGDTGFKGSLKRIAKQARSTHLFDQVEVYTPSDLPPPVRNSPLMVFHRGGGYWVWKPWIVYNTLCNCKEGDVVYYVDAGCTLNKESKEWGEWDSILNTHNAIVFNYRSDVKYAGWDLYCKDPKNCAPELRHWLKPSAEEYFTRFLGSEDYLNFNHVMSGIIIIKKTANIPCFIQQWLKIALLNPSLFCDAYGEELGRLPDSFNEHRHDQAILTPLVYYYKDIDKIVVLHEKSESRKEIAAVIASRTHIRSWTLCDKLAWRIKKCKTFVASAVKRLSY